MQLTERFEASVWSLNPEHLDEVAMCTAFPRSHLQHLRQVLLSEPCRTETLHERFAARPGLVRAGCLMAECGPNVFAPPHESSAVATADMVVGTPLPHLSVDLLDQQGRPCGPGGWGELTLAGAGLAAGYYDSAEAWNTALRHGRLHTGWAAYRDAEGVYRLLGRYDGD